MPAAPFPPLLSGSEHLQTPPVSAEALRKRLAEVYGVSAACVLPVRGLVAGRNRFSRGEAPHPVDRFVADLVSDFGPGIDQVASGAVDTFLPGPRSEESVELARRYGVNKSQFLVVPGNALRVFVINTSRPLFRNNVPLRQAVNFAVDREALVREAGPRQETPTDQYLLSGKQEPRQQHRRHHPEAGQYQELHKSRKQVEHV